MKNTLKFDIVLVRMKLVDGRCYERAWYGCSVREALSKGTADVVNQGLSGEELASAYPSSICTTLRRRSMFVAPDSEEFDECAD